MIKQTMEFRINTQCLLFWLCMIIILMFIFMLLQLLKNVEIVFLIGVRCVDRYRNTWVWGCTHEGCGLKPKLEAAGGEGGGGGRRVKGWHESLGEYQWAVDQVRPPSRTKVFKVF